MQDKQVDITACPETGVTHNNAILIVNLLTFIMCFITCVQMYGLIDRDYAERNFYTVLFSVLYIYTYFLLTANVFM